MDAYEEGRYIDALDSVNTWCLAEVVSVDQRTLNIHFDGWSSKWDCVTPSSLMHPLVLQNEFIQGESLQKIL